MFHCHMKSYKNVSINIGKMVDISVFSVFDSGSLLYHKQTPVLMC